MRVEYALEKCMPLVRFLVGRGVACPEDREDIEQQIALAIVRRCGSIPAGSIRAYVRGICRNTIHGYYRARNREDSRRARPPCDAEEMGVPEEQFDVLWRSERLEALDLAVDLLPQRFRSVVMVHVYQGKNLKDVAALLGINHATARWRLHRAIQLMRESIDHTGYRR